MKKILRVGANVVAWIVLIFALLITIIVFSSGKNNGVANLFGYIPMTVESDSMKPTFSKNDLIICKEIDDLNSLKEGDVIIWTSSRPDIIDEHGHYTADLQHSLKGIQGGYQKSTHSVEKMDKAGLQTVIFFK